MTNYKTGHDAEKQAASYLENQGFEIIDLNWKTPVCEVDIIARKTKIVYFVEVKYRKNITHGHGLDYITPKKLKQMAFAAEIWVQKNNYKGQYQLAAVGIEANNFSFVEIT